MLFELIINLVKILLCTEKKNAAHKFIEAMLGEYYYCKKIIKKHFNKNLVINIRRRRRKISINEYLLDL